MNSRGRLNFGLAMNRTGAIFGIALGALITLGALALGGALLASHHTAAGVTILILGVVFGALPLASSIRTLSQLMKPGNLPQDVSQFASADRLDVRDSLPSATVNPGETMLNWLGPVMVVGFKGGAQVVMGHEVDRNPFNTILFTDRQMLGLMLGPDDLEKVQGAKGFKAITFTINQSAEMTTDKNEQFRDFNRNKWADMVASVMQPGLESVVEHHVNFGLPYSSIRTFHAKTGMFARWLRINLADGRTVHFSTIQGNDMVRSAGNTLGQFVARA